MHIRVLSEQDVRSVLTMGNAIDLQATGNGDIGSNARTQWDTSNFHSPNDGNDEGDWVTLTSDFIIQPYGFAIIVADDCDSDGDWNGTNHCCDYNNVPSGKYKTNIDLKLNSNLKYFDKEIFS